ncbi:hypothetical protein FOL46_007336 [Perkinsus olseni]|uniref:TRUD domain-containing protein n=1 Tax=Perkinsus olseni TaxID=32597 RepID=A0A7J6LEH1_PEROL|nr:hypothetical protein FOL46_007336 [Perkinsus olseni]
MVLHVGSLFATSILLRHSDQGSYSGGDIESGSALPGYHVLAAEFSFLFMAAACPSARSTASGEFLSLLGMRSATVLDDTRRPFGGTLRWSRNDDRVHEEVDLVIGRDGFAVREIPIDSQTPLELHRSLRSYVSTKRLGAHLLKCPFVQLTVQKYLMDTQSVVRLLAHHSECTPEDISYAGRKDKHADTTQHLTMPREAFLRLFRKHRHLRLPFRVGDPLGVEKPLKLSDLSGNYFRLVFAGDSKVIESEAHDLALSHIAEEGFVNYFGTQRFGSPRYMTPVAGWHLNTGRVEEAVLALLAAGEQEPARRRVAERIAGKDFKSLQRNLPEDVTSRDDHDLIEAIVKYPKRLWRTKIPARLWSTYNNAFESLLWNYAVSSRIGRYGMTGVSGDLCLGEDGRIVISSETGSELPDFSQVVLPTPTRFGLRPDNSTGEFISTMASRLGVREDPLKHHGRFRPLLVKPRRLQWERRHGKLSVTFVLPPGSFATSLVREWLGMNFFQPGGGQSSSSWLPDACFARLNDVRQHIL